MYKVRFKERLFILLFACFLAIYPPTVKYQQVQALEWVAPAIGFETALKFLLGLLGVTLTSKVVDENVDWGEVRQNCVNFQIQQGNDAVAVSKWWDKVLSGTLDQASSCWTSFKEWVSSLGTSSSSPDVVINGNLCADVVRGINEAYHINLDFNSKNSYLASSNCYSFIYYKTNVNNSYYLYLILSNNNYVLNKEANPSYYNVTSSPASSFQYTILSNNSSVNGSVSNSASSIRFFIKDNDIAISSNINDLTSDDVISIPYEDGNAGASDSDYDVDTATSVPATDIDLTTENTTSTSIPDTIPLPWENVGADDNAISDTYDDLVEQVNEGVLSVEGFMEGIQELLGVIAIDTTNDEILPIKKDDDGNNETLKDKATENISNYGFTLSGLEKVFPFCIPWDIYSFVTLLVAEPVAPVFQFPIYNPVNDTTENINVDMSAWENVVVLVRYIFDFLLIIGLLLLARSLIGAEG